MSMEEQRLTMLKRLNDIDAELSRLSKHAIAAQVADRTRTVDRRQVRAIANQTRNELQARRQKLVAEKGVLTADYCRLKSMIRQRTEQPSGGAVVRLLTAILARLGGKAEEASEPDQPRARPTA